MRPTTRLRPTFACIAACLTLAGSCLAQTFGNFTYTTDGTSVTITGHSLVAVPSLVIPAEIGGVPVRTVSSLSHVPSGTFINGALAGSVTSLTIPEGVTTLGVTTLGGPFQGPFRNFTALTSVTLPSSVTSMGTSAFLGCTALATVNLPDGITALDRTFEGCTALTTIDLPDQLLSMNGTFKNCTGLTSIQLPATVTTTEETFMGCTQLTSVSLPAGLTALGSSTFSGCTGLQNIDFLPAGLATIGDYAFRHCTGLTSLNLPPALTSIGIGTFEGCTGVSSVTVPDTVTLIGDNTFWGCQNLDAIEIPDRFLASIANLGLDYHPQLASDLLVDGIADRLASSPDFISKLADAIIAKTGHYGLSTQADIAGVVNQTPQTVRDVIAELGGEGPAVHGITSDLAPLTVKKRTPVSYAVTTTFGATAFSAGGLPAGLAIHPETGVISGRPRKAGTYHVFLHAGVAGGGVVSAVKVIVVTP